MEPADTAWHRVCQWVESSWWLLARLRWQCWQYTGQWGHHVDWPTCRCFNSPVKPKPSKQQVNWPSYITVLYFDNCPPTVTPSERCNDSDFIKGFHLTVNTWRGLSVPQPCGRLFHDSPSKTPMGNLVLTCWAVWAVEQTNHGVGPFITYSNEPKHCGKHCFTLFTRTTSIKK